MSRLPFAVAIAATTLSLAACATPAAAPEPTAEVVAAPTVEAVPATPIPAAANVAPAVQIVPLQAPDQYYVGVPAQAAVLAADSDGVGNVVLTINGATVSTVPVDNPGQLYQGNLSWTPSAAGAADAVVLVTDVNGAVTTAQWATIQVLEAPAAGATPVPAATPSGDTIAPSVSIAPMSTEVKAGEDVDVAVNAVDQGGVVKMELYANDELVETWQYDAAAGPAQTSVFYTFTYRDTKEGQYDVYVKAYDAAGNAGQSNTERIDVNPAG
jgi:hypothetical protein